MNAMTMCLSTSSWVPHQRVYHDLEATPVGGVVQLGRGVSGDAETQTYLLDFGTSV